MLLDWFLLYTFIEKYNKIKYTCYWICYLIDSCCKHSLKNIIKSSILVIEYIIIELFIEGGDLNLEKNPLWGKITSISGDSIFVIGIFIVVAHLCIKDWDKESEESEERESHNRFHSDANQYMQFHYFDSHCFEHQVWIISWWLYFTIIYYIRIFILSTS